MRKFLRLSISVFFVFSLGGTHALQAQSFANAGSYMNYISGQYNEIMKDFLSYTSAVAHGKSARKVDNRRVSLIQTTKDARKKIAAMAPYEGDKSLRDSAVAFLDISFHILNDDYGKIVNMEEVAEQSYDAMEAYMLAQELANEKLDKAGDRLDITNKAFAAKHNVTLIESKDEVSEKMAVAAKVNQYQRKLYLIFFKCYKQEMYLIDAITKKNVSGIEQNKNTLLKYAEEGLAKLDTMKAFKGDNSIVLVCRQLFQFYKDECSKIPAITSYYIKEENYQKAKKAFETKRESDRTQADVDVYNKATNEFNAGVNEFNNTNTQLYNSRSKLIDSWNKTTQTFLDKHTPKYK